MTNNLNVKDPALYKILSSLSKIILDILSERISRNEDNYIKSLWVKQENDFYVKKNFIAPFWSFILIKNEIKDKISNTPEYSTFLDIINSNDDISYQIEPPSGTNLSFPKLEAMRIAQHCVHAFLNEENLDNFELKTFNSAYFDLEEALYSKFIVEENLIPLGGFSMDASEIILQENISIVKLTENEILQLLDLGINLSWQTNVTDYMHEIFPFAIKTLKKTPKTYKDPIKIDHQNDPMYSNKEENIIIDTLRVFKEGVVYPIANVSSKKGMFSFGTTIGVFTNGRKHISKRYFLENEELHRFKSYYEKITNTPEDKFKFLHLGIRRFSSAIERIRFEDKLVDLMISAESILINEKTTELTYKLSHRAAMLLGKTTEDKKRIFQFMKKAYDIRSSIVHGKQPKFPKKADNSEYNLIEFCDELEDYLRDSMLKIIKIIVHIKDNKIDWEAIVFPEEPSSDKD